MTTAAISGARAAPMFSAIRIIENAMTWYRSGIRSLSITAAAGRYAWVNRPASPTTTSSAPSVPGPLSQEIDATSGAEAPMAAMMVARGPNRWVISAPSIVPKIEPMLYATSESPAALTDAPRKVRYSTRNVWTNAPSWLTSTPPRRYRTGVGVAFSASNTRTGASSVMPPLPSRHRRCGPRRAGPH